ncbi:MAG: sulfite exporter TauE/SafE family protein [Leadbetterella sp.]|nr:sulfite exporter TauE/SafE family protein [Leadbetterella sp.]
MNLDFSILQWVFMVLAAFIIGFSKAGIKGLDVLNVLLMAVVFGGKASTGVILPLLCFADILAVIIYKRHVEWKYFWKLIPAMIVGVLCGVWFGQGIDEQLFKRVISVIIVLTVVIMVYSERSKNTSFPNKVWFSTGMGLLAGFVTMMGNLAGAISNIYFLALKLDKNTFIGTAAWIFLVINFFKLPFQIIFWNNITTQTLLLDLIVLPALMIGFYIGLKLVGKVNDAHFRKLVMAITFLGALLILFK